MKKFTLSLTALLFALVFAFNGVAFGWGASSGDGSNYRQLQETAVFYNNSGKTLSAGNVVILDTAGTGVTADTTLGSYVTTTTGADSILVIGVVHESQTSILSGSPIIVVTKGPVNTRIADSTDAVSLNTAVGTSAGCTACAGGGTNLGIALEAGDGTDGDGIIVWVDTTGAD